MSLLCFERLSYCLAPEIHGIQNISTLSDNLVLYFQTFIVLILLLNLVAYYGKEYFEG